MAIEKMCSFLFIDYSLFIKELIGGLSTYNFLYKNFVNYYLIFFPMLKALPTKSPISQ